MKIKKSSVFNSDILKFSDYHYIKLLGLNLYNLYTFLYYNILLEL